MRSEGKCRRWRGTDIETTGHTEHIIASAAYSLRRHKIYIANVCKIINNLYATAMSLCLTVCLSVRLSSVKFVVIRYVAAPGGARGLIISPPIHLFSLCLFDV